MDSKNNVSPMRRARWPFLLLVVIGAVAGVLLVASETVTSIQADRDDQSEYQFTVAVFGQQVHHSTVATTEELLPTMRVWAYSLMAAFGFGGAIFGAAIGSAGCCRTNCST